MSEHIQGTQAAYARIAPEYAQRWSGAVDWVNDWADGLAAGSRIADIGCGPGQHTRAMRERGFRVTGLDLSASMLASLGVPGLVQADMLALPLAPASLDAIWCSAALLHIPRGDVPVVLAGFARALRPGGKLGLSVAEGDGEGWEPVPYAPELRRFYVRHRLEPLSALLTGAAFRLDDYQRHSSNRDWLSIHATREDPPPGRAG